MRGGSDSKALEAGLAIRAENLRAEIRRITNTTLSGSFVNSEDRTYWADRAKKLSGELSAIEEMTRPRRVGAKANQGAK